MTRSGYRTLLVVLAALSLTGVFFTIWMQWSRGAPTEMDCAVWERAPREGRFTLTSCELVPEQYSLDIGDYGDSVTGVMLVGTSQIPWRTSKRNFVQMTDFDARGERAYERWMAVQVEELHTIDVEAARELGGMTLRDLTRAKVRVWVGLIPLMLFGFPLLFLVRSQRRWRQNRLAWERSKGIVTEGDKPTSF